MSSILVIGTLWLILAAIVVMLFSKFWKSVSEFLVFNKNPEQYLKENFSLIDKFRSELPLLNKEELSLLSANSILVKKGILGQEFTTGYIRNIYQENLAVYAVRDIGVNKRLYIFSDHTGHLAFREISNNNYRVYEENANVLGELKADLSFIWKSSAIAAISRDTDGRNSGIRIGEKQVAGIAKYDKSSKVPQRYFSFIDNDEISTDTSFRILMYASLLSNIK